ncbi:MAG: heme-binding protein [Candidatus Thiodiazotropha sp. (ex Epidulcina cf. delphinae)]|nr:heme-binding protein [Candidatus Thiodiazotropha sp. (ex Epidulcina cf. delphinae)]
MKRMIVSIGLLAGISLSLGAIAEDASPTVTLKRLSLETANRIALGAIEACRKQGVQVGVSVVDRDGALQVVMRDTIAASITVPISRQKAFTAANFNAPTSALKDRADTPIGRIDGLVMSAGGLPVQAGGQLLGGVGVSGAPSGETDEACAQAGIDKVIDDLEMAM